MPTRKPSTNPGLLTSIVKRYASPKCIRSPVPLTPITIDKLSFDLDGKSWSPSAPSAQFLAAQTSRPPSAQSLRTRSQNRPPSHSPSPLRTSAPQSRDGDSETGISDVKSIKENWFAGLGAANAERPDHLPPSQGGRYAGFGSTPEPPPEALALSSKALPTFQDVQNDPGAALSKGWSFLSTAFVSASKAVNETIIQPGMQVAKENAPVVQKSVGQFAATATQSMGQLSGQVKEKTGVDVAEGWGTLVDKVKAIGIAGQTPEQRGYSGVDDGWGEHEEEGSALYRDEPDSADFFTQFESPSQPGAGASKDSNKDSSTTPKPAQIQAQEVEKEGWDDWKEF
jgi:ADP-ribosylation factor GTPase-activating protein 1